MHRLILLTAVVALAGCAQERQADPAIENNAAAVDANLAAPAAPAGWTGFEPGSYTVTAADGTKREFVLKPDGSYTSTDAAGKTTTGSLVMKSGKGCFTPAGGKEMCWTNAAPGADGSWMATADDGSKATILKKAALASINETTWEFTDPDSKKPIQESVDAAGKYIAVSGKEHIDHGTAAMKDGKACFTSAMTKEGEVCWTDPMVAVGQSGQTTSDKGEKLTVKRTAYVPLSM